MNIKRVEYVVSVSWDKVTYFEDREDCEIENISSELIARCKEESSSEPIFRHWENEVQASYTDEFRCDECLEDVTKCTCDKSDT